MTRKQTSSFSEVCASATQESSISRAVLAIVALGALSYLPIYNQSWLLAGRALLYSLTLLAFGRVLWLAVVEKAVRLPRTTLALPALAFASVLLLSELKAGASFGLANTGRIGGGIAANAMLIPFAYLGYLFADSRRDRRRIFVMITFLITTAAILEGLRVWAASLGLTAVGNPLPRPAKMIEMGIYLSFVLPMLATQSVVRRSWLTRYSPMPALVIGTILLAVAAPPLALLAPILGSALAPLFAGRKATAIAASFLLIAVLTTSVLLENGGNLTKLTQTSGAYAARISGFAAHSQPQKPVTVSPQGRAMGAFPIVLLLGLLAAFLMQGLPALVHLNDVEKAFALGTLTGMGGYAVASIAYGNSFFATPTIWLLMGAGARLINPNPEPVLKLNLRPIKEEGLSSEM